MGDVASTGDRFLAGFKTRNYKIWDGNQKLHWCKGKVFFGPSPQSAIGTLVVINTIGLISLFTVFV
jgi:hypothetical protein